MGLVLPEQELTFNGNARAWVDLRDAESRAVYLSRAYWPEIHPIVAAFLRRGGHFFDVGANFGLVTLGAIPLLEGKGVGFHLFEANARIIPTLHKSAALWPGEKIAISHCCVTDRPGRSGFMLTDAQWGRGRVGEQGEEVRNLVLDDYIENLAIDRIPFMKMDIEGSEPLALNGARRSLAAGKIEALFVEFIPEFLRKTIGDADLLLESLSQWGFDIYFVTLYKGENFHGRKWVRADVNGETLWFARARPVPETYTSGDILAVFRSTALGLELARSAPQ